MKIIISPAKKMRVQTDIMEETGMPVFLEDAKRLHDILKAYSMEQLKKLFGANDAITRQNYERYQTMDLERSLTPAVLAYVGLQYQSMAPDIFTASQWEYVKELFHTGWRCRPDSRSMERKICMVSGETGSMRS